MIESAAMSKHLTPPKIQPRSHCDPIFKMALQLGLTSTQARLVANRLTLDDLQHPQESPEQLLEKILFPKLKHIQTPDQLKASQAAAHIIADAIQSTGKIVLATDYDTDGVTSAWVATRALIDYFNVPAERIVHIIGERKNGYGISDEVVDQVLSLTDPVELIITADQGSSDEPRIARLAQAGIPVCVTDHHQIAEDGIPKSAVCTVNPQQLGCEYDKTIAGCFVIFLVMSQTRRALIARGYLSESAPSLKDLALNVALGTIADSVSLKSHNNRAIVQAGLAQINTLNNPAWQAVHAIHGQNQLPFNAEFLGFQVATRINAASRVSDVTTAFKFLNATSVADAEHHLRQLGQDNLERREQQTDMLNQAQASASAQFYPNKYSLVVRMTGNAGIQGIIASRIGEQYGVPTIAMTDLNDGTLAGSGRGIVPNIDLREAFQWMSEQQAGMFLSMGGHKGAAGCMIYTEFHSQFVELFEQAIQKQLGSTPPTAVIETDGDLLPEQLTTQIIHEINQLEPFGREWPQPVFSGVFRLISIHAVGQTKTHLSCRLQPVVAGSTQANTPILSAIYFNALPEAQTELPFRAGDQIVCAYQPSLNEYKGNVSLQLKIQTIQGMTV